MKINNPLISIITVCYNSEEFIESALESVLGQDYSNIEYLIVDGGSKDSTLEIIERYKNKIAKIISESDKGIYDAMNKGIEAARGEFIAFLNSDDYYINKGSVSKLVSVLLESQTDSVYADVHYVEPNSLNVVRKWKSKQFYPGGFKKVIYPAHPTFVVKRSIYNKYGLFDLNFPLAADFDIMYRFLEVNRISTQYIPLPLIAMRTGGATNASLRNIIIQNREIQKVFSKYGNRMPVSYIIIKLFKRLSEYLRK